jgi:cytidine deaminase
LYKTTLHKDKQYLFCGLFNVSKNKNLKKLEVKIELAVTDRKNLSDEEEALIATSVNQLDFAYAPYSNFYVGAAVLMEDGSIYGGCNQENASYPLCMCGERVALYHATIAKPNTKVKAIAITARNPKMKMSGPVMPCGACRQVILEYENRHAQAIKLYFRSDDEQIYITQDSKCLLPFGFDATFL